MRRSSTRAAASTASATLPADTSNTAAFAALAARMPDDAIWLATPLSRTQATAGAIRAR